MTHLLEKHEAIFTSYFAPTKSGCKDGEVVEHCNRVEAIHFYEYQVDGTYRKVFLTKAMVIDFYEKIQEIESQSKMMEYSGVPF